MDDYTKDWIRQRWTQYLKIKKNKNLSVIDFTALCIEEYTREE